jgi:hypothetical protein
VICKHITEHNNRIIIYIYMQFLCSSDQNSSQCGRSRRLEHLDDLFCTSADDILKSHRRCSDRARNSKQALANNGK